MNEPDPYQTLRIPHSASAMDIKRAYHSMARQYHPDKLNSANEQVRYRASSHFAQCAAAYALLTDPQRKAAYDHIYKYGGFDAVDDKQRPQDVSLPQPSDYTRNQQYHRKKRRTMGIGYTCHDPCAFIWTMGKLQSRQTVAGVQIPSRIPSAHDGFCVALSSGRVIGSPSSGTTRCISETTLYYPLGKKKVTTRETVTYHPDGRKEVCMVDGDGCERQYSSYPNLSHQKELPWYSNAWKQVQDKLSMCFNPCAAVEAQ